MSDQNESQNPAGGAEAGKAKDWEDLGNEFQQLGESLAQAFRAAWNNEENRQRVEQLRTGMESMVQDVGAAIHDTANSPEGQQLRSEARQTARTLVDAGEQAVQEAGPHLVNALKHVNAELQKLIGRLEQQPPAADPDEGRNQG